MFNSIQLFGFVLLGGLLSGEVARRLAKLPRTTGYVLFGMLVGQSGFNWVTALHIESAQLFIDLALGLILFELGHLVPAVTRKERLVRLRAGTTIAFASGGLVLAWFLYKGIPAGFALFAAALCLATSPAITIATCSDVGAKGERTGLLYTLVAINGVIAFAIVMIILPFIDESQSIGIFGRLATAVGGITGSLFLGGACAAVVLLGARHLERQAEHQHLLILGAIVLGVGTAIHLDISVFLPMLVFGILVRAFDSDSKVVAIRIASDARVFLVITFVLAGASLDIGHLFSYWREALVIALARFVGQWAATWSCCERLNLTPRESLLLGIGLQPMSSVALVLLVNTQMLHNQLSPDLVGMLMATILLMQLLGPLATQTAIVGFGEATRLQSHKSADSTTTYRQGAS